MGLNVTGAAVSLSVQADGNDACEQTVVVRLLNGGLVVGLLRRVAVLGALVRNGNHDFRGVGVPTVVRLGRRVGLIPDSALSVLPRKTGPVRTGAPVFA